PTFYWRVFNEVTAYWMSRKPRELVDKNFRIFVIFVDEAHDPGNDVLLPVPPHSIVCMTLKQALTRLTDPGLLIVLEPLTVPDVETLHARIPYYREQLQQLHLPESERTVLQGLLVQAILTRFPSLNREEVKSMITLTPLRETRVFQEFGQEFLEEGMQKGLQQGIQQGLQQGRQEGLQKGLRRGLRLGRNEGKLETTKEGLLKFWSLRLGPPAEWVRFRLQECQSLELLELLQEKIYLSASVDEAQAHVKAALGNGT
ncbi:MAG: DUF2887 domain-containing protein, partial [Myxococcota bacterium]